MSNFLSAAWGADTPTAPIWLMRQAGRYLPEYRTLKERHGFWRMCRTPEIAAEITLQPVRRFPLDAAILFNDIMTPLPPMGVDVDFDPGPVIREPVRTPEAVRRLRVPTSEEVAPFVAAAVRLVRQEHTVPLIGFAGAPLTLAAYLVQGSGGSADYPEFRAWLARNPELAHELLDKLTCVSIGYVRMQVDAGAQAIQIFDSWAGIHDERGYAEFGLPYAARVLNALDGLGVPRDLSRARRITPVPADRDPACRGDQRGLAVPAEPLPAGHARQGNPGQPRPGAPAGRRSGRRCDRGPGPGRWAGRTTHL